MSAFLLSITLLVPGTTDAELLAVAESAFAEGLRARAQGERGAAAFRRSATAYDELRQGGVHNADLYHNLGNARWLAGDLPRAILAYRVGLRLAPGDRRLRDSLAAAREQVVYANGSALGRPGEEAGPLRVLGHRELRVIAAVLYVLGCVALARWWMVRQAWARGIAALCLLSAVLLGVTAWHQARPAYPVVVIARDGVLLRKGNGHGFPPWPGTPMNRGVEAEVVYENGEWMQIQLAGGQLGWVHTREVVRE